MSAFSNNGLGCGQCWSGVPTGNHIHPSRIFASHEQIIMVKPPDAFKQNRLFPSLVRAVMRMMAGFGITVGVFAAPAANWQTMDIGAVGEVGSFSQAQGEFIIRGAGEDIWGQADAFRFCFQPMAGDCTVMTRVVSINSAQDQAKAGVMIRESLDANAKYAILFFTPTTGAAFEQRPATAASSLEGVYNHILRTPYWLCLTRSGDVFAAFTSENGVTWEKMGSITISMNSMSYAGLVVCSRNKAALSEAHFDNVAIKARPSSRK